MAFDFSRSAKLYDRSPTGVVLELDNYIVIYVWVSYNCSDKSVLDSLDMSLVLLVVEEKTHLIVSVIKGVG